MFGQDWDKAEATIVARDAKFTGDGSVATYTFVADVRLPSGETFRTTVHEPTIATDFWAPSVRDVVSVLVRPRDRKVKFDKDDERLSARAFHAARRKALGDALRQPAGTPTDAWNAPTDLPDAVASRLAQLGIVGGAPVRVFPADPPAGFTPAAPAAQTPEARLLQLQALYERGLLTAEEYAEQRHRILNEI